MKNILILLILLTSPTPTPIMSPVNTLNRQPEFIELTGIGQFGIERKARPDIPAHLHTGIDIKRPSNNYQFEPIFAIADGMVISKRTDGPYAQLMIEHLSPKDTFWTLYEHISEIQVSVGQPVNPGTVLARFFNKEELNEFGWQFDHFHFEILKTPPRPLIPSHRNPERFFMSHTLDCYTKEDLRTHFHNPIQFLTKF